MSYHLYADDTQVYVVSEMDNIDHQMQRLEAAISDIKDWMQNNMLKLNTKKTELLLISNKNQLDALVNKSLLVGQDRIQPSERARNIGVTFDSTFSMVPHINAMTSSLNYHLRNISRIRKFLAERAAETLIHSLITSRLDYANALLMHVPACHLRPLQRAQNTAARIITRTQRTEHITPVLQALHWLPVEARIQFKILTLTFKALHNMAPDYLADLLELRTTSRELRSTDTGLLALRPYRTERYGGRAFSVNAPITWNLLPCELRTCENFNVFKIKLKTHLFILYYQ